jgi:outer membrane murein-binding lipoprotein Lpp
MRSLQRTGVRASVCAVALALGGLLSLGCSSNASSSSSSEAATIPECDAYAARLEQCMGATSPPAQEAARQASDLATADDATRDRMKQACAVGLQRLTAACR